MEASKIGFSNIDNTAFEGRKKKVKKESPKREKIKENAKKMALFLAGLATLGAATVLIAAKDKPLENKESCLEDKTKQDEETEQKQAKPNEVKDKKPTEKKELVYLLPKNASSVEQGAEDAATKGVKAPKTAQKLLMPKKMPLMLPPHIDDETVEAEITDLLTEIDKMQSSLPKPDLNKGNGAKKADSKTAISASTTIADEDFQKMLDDHLETFMANYRAQEEGLMARQEQGFQDQLAQVSKLLDESVASLEEDDGLTETAPLDEDFSIRLEMDEIPDIDNIIADMASGYYGKNAENAVKYHLDDAAVEIYRQMNPDTIATLSNHFIEMTITKDAMGNSDKGMLKRLKGMEKKFTPSGIKKIASTEEGLQRLTRYILGIEYVGSGSLTSNTFKDKVVDMQKYSKAKKENLNWLMQTARN